MSETFTPLARSRASYYCKGSPVHFVMVELFKMESTGSTVVTLTFKNLYSHPIKQFTAHYRCKNRAGEVLCEDDFEYFNVGAQEGECFGSDDGVFISDEPLGSVEVTLVSVMYDDDILHSLKRCPPVALPPLRPLPDNERAVVRNTLNLHGLRYYPEEVADGWRCACGGFNYNAGKGKYRCSECGADKAAMLAAVQAAQRTARPQQPMYNGADAFRQEAQLASAPVRPHEYSGR